MTRLSTVLYLLARSAWRGLASSRLTSVVSVLTIAVAVSLMGAFVLLAGNMRVLLDRFGEDLQVTAYLERGVDGEQMKLLAESATTVEGVERVELVTPDEALERFRARLANTALLDGLDENPLPASLQIHLLASHRNPEGLAVLEQALTGLPGIEELAHGQEWIEGYTRATSLVRIAGLGLGLVLGFAALLIVANTIRLALYTREDELEILSLVGASRTFVRLPFFLEGTMQGLAGGLIAAILLYLSYLFWLPRVHEGLSFFLGSIEPRFFELQEFVLLVLAGAALGGLGSITALVSWRGSSG